MTGFNEAAPVMVQRPGDHQLAPRMDSRASMRLHR